MNFLGIDIGRNNHVASLINSDGKPVFRAFSFSNTTGGGEALIVGGCVFLVMYMIGKKKGKIE